MQNQTDQRIDKSYDAIVIGAGNGGMAAAATLAVNGVKPLVLEQHNLPGGFATSFVRGRFEFEAVVHEVTGVGGPNNKGPVWELLNDRLGAKINWVDVPEAFRMFTTHNGEKMDVRMPFGVKEYTDQMEKYVPGSRESMERFMQLIQEILDALNYIKACEGNPDRKVMLSKHSNFMKTSSYTLDQVVRSLKIPEKAKVILYAYWLYMGIPVKRCSFTVYAALMQAIIYKGAQGPRMRSHEFASALTNRIRECGGVVQFNTRVEKILVENGQVVGVETSQGDKLKVGHVIANLSRTSVFHHLIHPHSEVPEIAIRQSNSRSQGNSAFVVYLGLDATADELGFTDYSYFLFENSDTEQLYASFNRLDRPYVQAAICLNKLIPDCSPPGTTIVSITTLMRPEAWKDVTAEDYVSVKNRFANELIDQFENVTGIKLRDHIEEFEVATPQTFARYTRTYNGGVYGYEPDTWDGLVPRLMMMDDDKVIKGLEFAGAYEALCHGCRASWLSGEIAGLRTKDNLKKEGRI